MNAVVPRRDPHTHQTPPKRMTVSLPAAEKIAEADNTSLPLSPTIDAEKRPKPLFDPPPQPSTSLSKKKAVLRTARPRWPRAMFCALSIMASLMAYSILQERIMTRPYYLPRADQTARDAAAAQPMAYFKNSLFLVLANRLFAAAVAVAAIFLRGNREELRSKAPLRDYISISLSNVVATSCQYEALKWLTFPTVTIGKCAKMLPVMLILNLRSGRQYSFEDFGVVGVVLSGCAVMISSGNVSAKRTGTADEDTLHGFALLVIYLLFDAITSTYQERLFELYDMTVYNQMLYINISSATLSIVGLTLSGGLFESLAFIEQYPRVVPDITTLSLSAVAGQFAITYTISAFGSLFYAGVMTTRQFCSVLASNMIFKHGLSVMQWTGALMVFSALFYKLWRKAVQSVE